MRHVAREPDPDVNVSKEHPLAEAGTLFAWLGASFVVVVAVLVFFVDAVLYFVPVEVEAEMFDSWLPQDIVTVAYDDERLLRVEALTARLARHYPESPYSFRVEIDDSDQPNAMAFPGGLIVVTTGLLDQVRTENELAFVLAHELGHFRNRDHLRTMGRGLVLSLWLLTAAGGDTATYGASLADMTLRSFNRGQESDADAFALELVQAEFGHVAEAWRFFERLAEEGGDASLFAQYGSTHPSSRNRIEDLVDIAEENGWRTSGSVTPIAWDE
jgi:Zn-dependent protease with chaperone function